MPRPYKKAAFWKEDRKKLKTCPTWVGIYKMAFCAICSRDTPFPPHTGGAVPRIYSVKIINCFNMANQHIFKRQNVANNHYGMWQQLEHWQPSCIHYNRGCPWRDRNLGSLLQHYYLKRVCHSVQLLYTLYTEWKGKQFKHIYKTGHIAMQIMDVLSAQL